MDTYCKHCGEPWDTDSFHNSSKQYQRIYTLFRKFGCPIAEQALDDVHPTDMKLSKCEHKPILEPEILDAIDATQDLLGDDVDGAASLLDDFMKGF